jgi:hypothetical protein
MLIIFYNISCSKNNIENSMKILKYTDYVTDMLKIHCFFILTCKLHSTAKFSFSAEPYLNLNPTSLQIPVV